MIYPLHSYPTAVIANGSFHSRISVKLIPPSPAPRPAEPTAISPSPLKTSSTQLPRKERASSAWSHATADPLLAGSENRQWWICPSC